MHFLGPTNGKTQSHEQYLSFFCLTIMIGDSQQRHQVASAELAWQADTICTPTNAPNHRGHQRERRPRIRAICNLHACPANEIVELQPLGFCPAFTVSAQLSSGLRM